MVHFGVLYIFERQRGSPNVAGLGVTYPLFISPPLSTGLVTIIVNVSATWMQSAMMECIPGVVNAVKMIFSISTYYNTPEQLNYLFAKVSPFTVLNTS